MVIDLTVTSKRVKFFSKNCAVGRSGEVVHLEPLTRRCKPLRDSRDRCCAYSASKKDGSSVKFVTEFWLRKFAKYMI